MPCALCVLAQNNDAALSSDVDVEQSQTFSDSQGDIHCDRIQIPAESEPGSK